MKDYFSPNPKIITIGFKLNTLKTYFSLLKRIKDSEKAN